MWIAFVFVSLMSVLTGLSMEQLARVETQRHAAIEHADQESLGVLLSYASKYVTANPGASGTIPLTALGMPNWYQALPGAGVYVQVPKVIYAYIQIPYGPEASRLVAAMTITGFVAGLARNGSLYSTAGQILASAPTSIPTNAVTVRYPQ